MKRIIKIGMDVLLIDPGRKDAQKITKILDSKNWAIDQCKNGLQALNKTRHFRYDLIITEIYTPIMDGISLCGLVKARHPQTKLIITTRETHYYKKIQAFHIGVDEYIVKPVTAEIIEEKIGKLVQSSILAPNFSKKLQIKDLVMNLEARRVYRFGEQIGLKRKEFSLLMFMMMNIGKTLNRHTILEHVWEGDIGSAAANIVDVYMNNLRKKIDKNHDKKLIQTVYGVGYKLCDM